MKKYAMVMMLVGAGLVSGSRAEGTLPVVLSMKGIYKLTNSQFSPDGSKLIVYGFLDNSEKFTMESGIQIWDAQTGKLLHTLGGYKNKITVVKFSIDGTRLITGCGDGTVKVWNPNSGELVSSVRPNTYGIKELAVNSQLAFFATSDSNNNIVIWNTIKGTPVGKIDEDQYGYGMLEFSKDGKMLIHAAEDAVRIRKFDDLTTIKLIKSSGSGMINSDTTLLLTKKSERIDNAANLYNVESGKLSKEFSNLAPGFWNSIGFSPDGSKIWSWEKNGNINIWDSKNTKLLFTMKKGTRVSLQKSFGPDGFSIAAEGDGHSISILSLNDGSLTKVLKGHSDALDHLSFSPDGTLILSSSNDAKIKVWNAQSGMLLASMEQLPNFSKTDLGKIVANKVLSTSIIYPGAFSQVTFNSNGTRILTQTFDRLIKLYDSSSLLSKK